ncbi:MAG: hypothetical protein JNK72_02565 [Myxococcales bacterium]|nr:hypothetical protein [Myxococcales bacterium]
MHLKPHALTLSLLAVACGAPLPSTETDAAAQSADAAQSDAGALGSSDAIVRCRPNDQPPIGRDAAVDGGAVDGGAVDGGAAAGDATIACGANFTCPEGYRCVGLATTQCVRTAPLGGACSDSPEARVYCDRSASCESVNGAMRCVAYGANNGVCRNTQGCSPRCDPGLGCDATTHCRPGLSAGAFCGAQGDFCNEGASCETVDGTARCIAEGARDGQCTATATCAEGLECTGVNSGAATGCNREYYHCTPRGVTPVDTRGRIGGRCRDEGPRCDEGLRCDEGTLVCVRPLALGDRCNAADRRAPCPLGSGCTAEHPADEGRCVAPYSEAGADCEWGSRCPGAQQCTLFSRYRTTCQATVGEGARCDLGGIAYQCEASTRCAPESVGDGGVASARCLGINTTIIPHASRQLLTRTTVVASTFSTLDGVACYFAQAPEGGALWLESNIQLNVTLSTWAGRELGRWVARFAPNHGPLGQRARLEPHSIAALRDLRDLGVLRICVSRFRDYDASARPVPFELAIGVLNRSW